MVTDVYDHILDEDRRKNAEFMDNAFYNKENFNTHMKYEIAGKSVDGSIIDIIGKDNEEIRLIKIAILYG